MKYTNNLAEKEFANSFFCVFLEFLYSFLVSGIDVLYDLQEVFIFHFRDHLASITDVTDGCLDCFTFLFQFYATEIVMR